MRTDRKQITISSKLFDLISTRIKNPQTGFSSIDEYVDYVLNELLIENENNNVEERQGEVSDKEAEKVKEELKKLGYI